METITTKSKSDSFAKTEEIILDDKPRTRIVLQAGMHPKGIRCEIIRYRKDSKGENSEILPVNFNELKADDGVRIELSTDAMNRMREKLKEIDQIATDKNLYYGKNEYKVVDVNALVIDDKNKAQVIQKILDAELEQEIWNEIVGSNPDLATKLAYARIYEERDKALKQFEQMLDDQSTSESDWQKFFERNTWIFGYGLRYQILNIVETQPDYGGADIAHHGEMRGDFLAATEAETRFTCLVEIKKPGSDLLGQKYRNGAWKISNELAGAIAQVQVNCAQWEISSQSAHNQEHLQGIYTVSPRGIVVIGNTSKLNDYDKRNSFERFRRALHTPEIITYDELLARARYINATHNDAQENEETNVQDGLPF